MPVEVLKPNDLTTRISQSFVNLTKYNSTKYPALTTVRVDYTTSTNRLTSYTIFDQYALRVLGDKEPVHDDNHTKIVNL
jgi:hypothetical protein